MLKAETFLRFGFLTSIWPPHRIFQGFTGASSLCVDEQNEHSRCAHKQNEHTDVTIKNELSRCADKQLNEYCSPGGGGTS